MEDLRSILTSHHSKNSADAGAIKAINDEVKATTSDIPDLFFDDILLQYNPLIVY